MNLSEETRGFLQKLHQNFPELHLATQEGRDRVESLEQLYKVAQAVEIFTISCYTPDHYAGFALISAAVEGGRQIIDYSPQLREYLGGENEK